MDSWIIQTKKELLKSEKENISSRLIQWESIVNECTKNEYMRAFKSESSDLIHLPEYKHQITDREMNVFLHLILRWNGLKPKLVNTPKRPKTYKEYLHKSKNWMNGNRAKHYSRTIYPFMIDCAEYYAQNISNIVFAVDNDMNAYHDGIETDSCHHSIQKQCNTLFCNILMYSYLVQLAQCRLRVTKIGRRVHLLCDNSMTGHKSNTTTQMLQKYAHTHPYVDQFPSHREEAVDYFNQQKHSAFHQLFLLYQKRKTIAFAQEYQLIHNTIIHSENITNLMSFIKGNCNSKDGQNVYIDKDTFKVIKSLGVMLEDKEKENTQRINDLRQDVDRLQRTQMQMQPYYINTTESVWDTEEKVPFIEPKVPYAYTQSEFIPVTPCDEQWFPTHDAYNNGIDSCPMIPTAREPQSCFHDDINNIKMSYPWDEAISKDFGPSRSSSSSQIASDSNNLSRDFTSLECDQGSIRPMPMSVDNNLLYSTHNDDISHPLYYNSDNIDLSF